ncbi:Cadherin domain protein [Novipirellula aureliae]|uniref:Cadherin domain protein n=1 Tax=Novipirellula aureliae TaxID=2527966 RepID=A0A5C6EA27_9BACT|nr:Cadherin domain protein [Novipirellula aureliae]
MLAATLEPVVSESTDNEIAAIIAPMMDDAEMHHESLSSRYVANHHDPFLPDFSQLPAINGRHVWHSTAAGDWQTAFAAAGPEDVVVIEHAIDFDGAADVHSIVIRDGGMLRFDIAGDQSLRVVNLQVLSGGALQIGTEAAPHQGTAEVVFKDVPFDLAVDPGQYGHGLIALGTVTMHGRTLAQTFATLDGEIIAGEDSLAVDGKVTDWSPGDRLLIPDSRQLFYTANVATGLDRYESLTVAAIEAGQVRLQQGAQFDHLGARNASGELVFSPHVANLSRNVVLRSENPTGVRGHTMLIGRAEIDIRYVEFRDLGRTTNDPLNNTLFDDDGHAYQIGTNQESRYPIHMHHLVGPIATPESGHQYTILGNAVHSSVANSKWGITIHGSHYGLIDQNVVYNFAGAGIVTEDGSESFNTISNNFISRISGTRGRGKFTDGREGSGIWLMRPNNELYGNVVSGATKAAYAIYGGNNTPAPSVRVPAYQGADPHHDFNLVAPQAMHLLKFDENVGYASHMGIELWYLGYESYYNPTQLTIADSVISDSSLWHINHTGIFGQQANQLKVRSTVILGDRSMMSGYNYPTGFQVARVNKSELKDIVIENYRVGIVAPTRTGPLGTSTPIQQVTPFLVDRAILANRTNVSVKTPSEDTSASLPPRYVLLRDIEFNSTDSGLTDSQNIAMAYRDGRFTNVVQLDVIEVENYGGVPGNNYRVFYEQQSPDFLVPETGANSHLGPNSPIGAPIGGLTNAQAWEQLGIAVAGAIAPGGVNSEARVPVPGIRGLAFPLEDHLLPPLVAGVDSGRRDESEWVTEEHRLQLYGRARPGAEVSVAIGGETLGITVANNLGEWRFDYSDVELPRGSYVFTAQSHSGNASSAASDPLTVHVFNRPPLFADVELEIVENAAVGTVVGSVGVSDPDIGDRVSLRIIGGDPNGRFAFDQVTGDMTVAASLDGGTYRGEHRLQIVATDRAGLTAAREVLVTVTPRVSGDWIEVLSYPAFPSLSAEEIQYLTPAQIASISTRDAFLSIPASSRVALTPSQVQALNMSPSGMVDGLTFEQRSMLTDSQVASLGGGRYGHLEFAKLPADRIVALTQMQLSSIPDAYGFSKIPAMVRAALLPEQVRGLNIAYHGMIRALTPDQVLQLTDEQLQSIATGGYGLMDLARVPASRITAILPSQISALTSAYALIQIPAETRAALTPEQVRALDIAPSGMIRALTPNQVLELTDEQLQSIVTGGYGFMDLASVPASRITAILPSQISALTSAYALIQIPAEARAALTPEQVRALDIAPSGMIRALTPNQVLELNDEQLRSIRSGGYGFMDLAHVPASRISVILPSQISALDSTYAFMQLPSAARRAMTTEQVSALNTSYAGMLQGLTSEQIGMLTDGQITSLHFQDFRRLLPTQILNLTEGQLLSIPSRWDFDRLPLESRLTLADAGIVWVDDIGIQFGVF